MRKPNNTASLKALTEPRGREVRGDHAGMAGWSSARLAGITARLRATLSRGTVNT